MKPILYLLLSIFCAEAYGQSKHLRTELGLAYGSYHHKTSERCDFGYLGMVMESPIDFSEYTDKEWFSAGRVIRNYEVIGVKRYRQSRDLRRELYFGARIAGQFQHRTLFIGTKEQLQEETVIDQKTGKTRQVLSFQTTALSELNDYLNISPYATYRFLINDHFSINSSASTGIMVPIRTGIQQSWYDGQIIREKENEMITYERRSFPGALEFEWHNAVYKPKMRFEACLMLEIKPLDKKPYYFTIGSLFGRQVSFAHRDGFTYKGYRLGIQSQF